ncbi:hypothetical protein GPECTOR_594g664 [Gonium pectorale]|uniref:Tyr recombinase domain-containing protein n=1 Tax=Gonium pectorale TaxID=33097 RepID=A0A150FUI7_GONPE|nr:hypothetical protein GPECTOR_594g664 [Gonium pectorale]|eukprot:KXZ41262.1 hypothetical protein GPECTOR_594g664 [Gonium pectorale]
MMVATLAIMFAGFLRFDDAAEICVHSDLLIIMDTHMKVFIPRSKTDQLMTGSWVTIARVDGPCCPVGLTERLLSRGGYKRLPDTAGEDVGPLLRAVQWTRAGGRLSGPPSVAPGQRLYSLWYSAFWTRLQKVKPSAGISEFVKPHSARIGGNSTAARNGVPAELRQAHGRWRTSEMVHHYTRRDLPSKLEVTRRLGLASKLSLRSAVL